MNRAERRARGIKGKAPTYNLSAEAIQVIKEEEQKKSVDIAFILLLTIPQSESKCYQYRKLIFYQLKNKKSITDIANYLKINVYTLRQYVDKVLEYNNITLKELKYYVVPEE